MSQEKLETMLMQNMAEQTKSIMVSSEVAYSLVPEYFFPFYLSPLEKTATADRKTLTQTLVNSHTSHTINEKVQIR